MRLFGSGGRVWGMANESMVKPQPDGEPKLPPTAATPAGPEEERKWGGLIRVSPPCRVEDLKSEPPPGSEPFAIYD